jgi:flavodoxin
MKSIIIVHSWHHNNTRKIADAMADVLDCQVKKAELADAGDVMDSDLTGFGAGIDSGRHYHELLEFARKLEPVVNKDCFIFSTNGVTGKKKIYNDHQVLRDILESRGYNVLGEFGCRGFNTNLFLKYFGGMNRSHPDVADINNAKFFAGELLLKKN